MTLDSPDGLFMAHADDPNVHGSDSASITMPSLSPTPSSSATMIHSKSPDPRTPPSPSPSTSASVSAMITDQTPAPTPPPMHTASSKSSKSSTSRGSGTPNPNSNSKKLPPAAPQLIGHLPVARTEALSTFIEIPANNYQYATLGRSREALESMTCDCVYQPGADGPADSCGPDSDCINRLTQVECLPDDCRCRSYCQNQRFQKREYADIEIVQTEKKGFGLRAARDLPKDAFIYEYVGDVVSPSSFKKRMRDYATEGIRHFYFMMLQKDEFIDATKKGGIGRFANHSCNPNCYVAKWTVGQHVRMGIFAMRKIGKHEELTFNYNVDRYGHEAQPCYCGEAKCVGFIGGKTQTDLVTMDDLYLDALGINEADRLELKGTKKKKGKKLDDPDFMPILKPIVEKDVPKVVQAIRQTQSRKVLAKLLIRIKITEDQAALRQIMRLRGFSLMTNILNDYASDIEMIVLTLECMMEWPLLQRNKVEDSKVIVPVKALADSEKTGEEAVKALAQKLVDHWETLPLAYRIPKRMRQDGEEEEAPTIATISIYTEADTESRKRTGIWDDTVKFELKPPNPTSTSTPPVSVVARPKPPPPPVSEKETRKHIAAIIAAAAAAKEEEQAAAVAAAKAAAEKQEKPAGEHVRKKHKSSKKPQTQEEKEANKEKRLLKLVGAVVVKCMSKHSKVMDHDSFKKHAKELTQIIADKEKKSSSYKEGKLDSLSEDKIVKIKKFSKEYIAKVLRKMEKANGGHRRRPSSTATTETSSSTLIDTPNSADGADVVMGEMTIEEAMDMDPDSESDSEGEGDGGSPEKSFLSPPDPMDASPLDSTPSINTSDPRRRRSSEDTEMGWEPPHKQLKDLNGVHAVP